MYIQRTNYIYKTSYDGIKSKNRDDQKLKLLNLRPGDKVIMQEKHSKGKLAPKMARTLHCY